jgi:flagellar protein FlgJ
MDVSSLIGNAQDTLLSGLSSQAAAKAKRAQEKLGDGALSAAEEKRTRKTAEEFEAFFIGQMMEHMMTGIEPDSMFGGGHGESMWRSMLNQEYGKELAKSGKLGIADHVMRGMLQAQEQRDAAATAAAAITNATSASSAAEPAEPAVMPTAGAFMPIRR